MHGFGERGGFPTGQPFRSSVAAGQTLLEARQTPQTGAKLAKLPFLKALPKPPSPPKPAIAAFVNIAPAPAPAPALAKPAPAPAKPAKLWTEIFRATKSQDILGNKKAVDKFRAWVQYRASGQFSGSYPVIAFLSGPAGTGKTTIAANLLRENNCHVFEVNASMERQKEMIADRLRTISLRRPVDGVSRSTGLILDEIDGTNMEDGNGAIAALQEFLKTVAPTASYIGPIICICNDRSNRQIRGLAKLCLDIRFYPLPDYLMKELAGKIQKRASIFVPDSLLDSYIKCAQGDVRKLINLLYLRPANINRLRLHAGDAFSDPFATTRILFKGTDSLPMLEHLMAQDADALPLLVQENYPRVCDTKQDLVPWAEVLSDLEVLQQGWNTTYWDPGEYAGSLLALTARIRSKKRDAGNDLQWPKWFEENKKKGIKAETLNYEKLVRRCDVRDLSLMGIKE